ncbi:MAG TPA: DUF1214 domain-containing protein [Steroidobacteraceae bacterium]|nr:DUF1214 domain-containing protein [Steroidobacteraceae bacterium]
MTQPKARLIQGALLACLSAGVAVATSAPPAPPSAFVKAPEAFARLTDDQARETEAYTLGVQAVLWGTQWVKAGESFRMFSRPLPAGAAPSPYDPLPHGIDVWGHARKLLNADTRLIETPNTETLYSIMVADLENGPLVIEHPDFGDRYFRTSIWDLHSDTHTISQKQDGGHPPPYAIVPVSWKGTIPAGLKTITVRGRYFQFAPHIAVYGEADLPNVHRLQAGLKVVALKDWGRPGATLAPGEPLRPIRRADTKAPPELMFFEELGETLKDLTVRDDEVGFARQLQAIGITLKDGFQFETLDAATIMGLKRAVLDGQTLAAHKARALSPTQPGGTWAIGQDLTSVENWLQRAGVGFGYVWGDLESEVLYPMVRADADGQPLTGKNHYVLHFAPGQLPPARYWRISMYDIEGFFFNNPIDRYGIGNMAEELQPDPDGGLTILIQHESPGKDKEANWLPTPAEGFFMIMRLYQPERRMYEGKYIVPGIHRVQ